MRIFVTHICPKDKLMDYHISLSASYFNYNLIEGNGFDKVYSIYPGFVKGRLEKLDDDTFEAIYSSWRWKGELRQKFARVIEQIKLFRKIPKESKVWYYNLNSLNVILILLIKIFKPSVQQNIIILDYTPDMLFNKLVLPLINSMHGRISLSLYDKFNQHNLVCLPGVVPIPDAEHPKIREIKKEFLLSGALKKNIAMLDLVLDAFAEMPDYTLHLSGVLLYNKEKLAEYTKRYPNIIFHGKMPYEEYKELLSSTPFSFNTRDPKAPENLCNFPSKVIEALLYNRIILSTIEYRQLEGIKYFVVGSTKEDFQRDIKAIFELPEDQILQYANQEKAVIERFNVSQWNHIMTQIENNSLKFQ